MTDLLIFYRCLDIDNFKLSWGQSFKDRTFKFFFSTPDIPQIIRLIFYAILHKKQVCFSIFPYMCLPILPILALFSVEKKNSSISHNFYSNNLILNSNIAMYVGYNCMDLLRIICNTFGENDKMWSSVLDKHN